MGGQGWAQVIVAVAVPLLVSILTAVAVLAYRQGRLNQEVVQLGRDMARIKADLYEIRNGRFHADHEQSGD